MTLDRIASLPAPVHIEGAVGEYLRRLHSSLQEHLTMRPLDFQNLVDGFEYASTTHATTHSSGGTDEVSHDDLADSHDLTTDIDHDTITNNHNLTTDIDHDALTNFASNEHFPWTDVTTAIGDIVTVNYKWTDELSGTHTGDTNWQTAVSEASGSGFAYINASGSAAGTSECRITIDGGSAITMTLDNNDTNYSFPVQYSSSLLIEFRVSNAAHTVFYQTWWNNA